MPVRTGTASPWREWCGDAEDIIGDQTTPDTVVYVRDGWEIGDQDLLVEALRADGVSLNISDGYRRVERTTFVPGLYGYVDEDHLPVRCDEGGETVHGENVDLIRTCVFALVY